MGEYLFPRDARNRNRFQIHYPYYGLFGSAEVVPLIENNELLYECHLLNGSVLLLKKSENGRKWIDATQEKDTQLSTVIGAAIEEFLLNSK